MIFRKKMEFGKCFQTLAGNFRATDSLKKLEEDRTLNKKGLFRHEQMELLLKERRKLTTQEAPKWR